MNTLNLLIRMAGYLHFALILVAALVPVVLNWRTDMRKPDRLSRQVASVKRGRVLFGGRGNGVGSYLLVCGFRLLDCVNKTRPRLFAFIRRLKQDPTPFLAKA